MKSTIAPLAAALATTLAADSYRFDEIARANTGGTVDFVDITSSGVSISADGEVTFVVKIDNVVSAVYRGDGDGLVEIANNASGGPLAFASFEGVPAINAAGQVAFTTYQAGGVWTIYRGDSGALTTIDSATLTPHGLGGEPAINAAGVVYFRGEGIFSGSGGTPTPLYVPGDCCGASKRPPSR